jgi:hypothetical protein
MPNSLADDGLGVSANRRVDGILQRKALTEKASQLGSLNANRILQFGGMLGEPAVEVLTSSASATPTRTPLRRRPLR